MYHHKQSTELLGQHSSRGRLSYTIIVMMADDIVRTIQIVNKAGDFTTIVDNIDQDHGEEEINDGEIMSGCLQCRIRKSGGIVAVVNAMNPVYVANICFAQSQSMKYNGQQKNKKSNKSGSDGIDGKEPTAQPVFNPKQQLSKVFDRMHSLNPTENAYTSITDPMYQSIQTTNKQPDMNNSPASEVSQPVCPILVANILASHAETYRHAGIMNCQDCAGYVDSLREALQYLQPEVFGKNTACSLQSEVSKERIFSSCQVNNFLPTRQDMERGGQQDSNKQGRTICYLAAAVLATLVLIVVIVVLTMMVASNELL